jgi:transcriptional regulator with XRE-family HTH domain
MPPRIGPKRPLRLYLGEWRTRRGLTQQQLADRLGTTDVTVSRWETGARQPDLNAQAAIAEALDIDPFDLRRHPDQPSADALLRDQPEEVREQAIRLIQAIRR